MHQTILAFDGSIQGGNPGGWAGYGYVIMLRHDTPEGCPVWSSIQQWYGCVGHGPSMSNNVAEYAGLLYGLCCLELEQSKHRYSIGPTKVMGDSQLVIEQMLGRYQIGKGLYRDWAIKTSLKVAEMRRAGWQLDFEWIRRDLNPIADDLSKKGAALANPGYQRSAV